MANGSESREKLEAINGPSFIQVALSASGRSRL